LVKHRDNFAFNLSYENRFDDYSVSGFLIMVTLVFHRSRNFVEQLNNYRPFGDYCTPGTVLINCYRVALSVRRLAAGRDDYDSIYGTARALPFVTTSRPTPGDHWAYYPLGTVDHSLRYSDRNMKLVKVIVFIKLLEYYLHLSVSLPGVIPKHRNIIFISKNLMW